MKLQCRSNREIAEAVGMKPKAVNNLCLRKQWKARFRKNWYRDYKILKWYSQGGSIKAIAEELGITYGAAAAVIRRKNA